MRTKKRIFLWCAFIVLLMVTFFGTSAKNYFLRHSTFSGIGPSEVDSGRMDLACERPDILRIFPTEILHLLLQCVQISPLVILEPAVVKCLDHATSDPCITKASSPSMYRFAVIGKKPKLLAKMVSDLAVHGWISSVVGVSSGIALLRENFTVIISLLEIRQNYWYLHGTQPEDTVEEPVRAFLGLNLTTISNSGNLMNKLFLPTPTDLFLWHWLRSVFIECNQTTTAFIHEEYPDRYTSKPKIGDSFVDIMAYVRDLMIKHGMTPMLAGGTALGWYRECGIIPDTEDIDFMFVATEWTQNFENDLKADKTVLLYWILGKPTDSLTLSVTWRGIKIDMFAMYEEDNHTWTGGMIIRKKAKLRWWTPKLDGICTADLKGHLFYTPCNVVAFLERSYGPKWYIPHSNDNWYFQKSAKNMRRHGKWTKKEWPLVYRKFKTTNASA